MILLYEYGAWGNCTITSGEDNPIVVANPFRYRGYYYDTETGLYYCNARYYDPQTGRFISADSTDYLDPSSMNGMNLYAYCINNPVNYFDRSGHMPEWLGWIFSGIAIVGGIILCATGVGGILGGVLIGAGAGSLINGYVTKANGGDFTVGYIGGAISGALCGIGAGLGGLAFSAATQAVNFSCIGYLTLGLGASFVGGFAGNLAGTVYTSYYEGVDIDWQETLEMSTLMGVLNVFAGIGSGMSSIVGEIGKVAVNINSKWSLRILAGFIAGGTEALYDLTSYSVSKWFSMF